MGEKVPIWSVTGQAPFAYPHMDPRKVQEQLEAQVQALEGVVAGGAPGGLVDPGTGKVVVKNETSFTTTFNEETGNFESRFSVTVQGREEEDIGIRPTGLYVAIEPIEQSDVTEGGVALPQIANRKSNEGRVVAKGPGRREFNPSAVKVVNDGVVEYQGAWEYLPIDLEIGDRVLYVRWSGHIIEVDSKKYVLTEEHNVVAVATNEDTELAFWQDRH
jgi:chaperonin GroES